MKDWLSDPRRRQLAILGGAVLVALLAAIFSLGDLTAPEARSEIGEPVERDFAEHIPDLGLIMVTTSEETYHLVRNADGWVLTENGDYPVEEARIAGLAQAISSMRFDQAMTRDERKFDLIGVGDPLAGGTGALLELGDGRGEVFAKMIVGYRSGRTYVRAPDDLQAWAVEVEDMPPLQRATAWLDLDPAKVAQDEILEASVRPLVGAAYAVRAVDAGGQAFQLLPPNDDLRVLAPYTLSIVGAALASLDPVDVAPAEARRGASLGGVHTTRLRDGTVVETTAWRMPDRGWITLTARTAEGASTGAQDRAAAINSAARDWIFAITEADWETFTAPLALLAVEE